MQIKHVAMLKHVHEGVTWQNQYFSLRWNFIEPVQIDYQNGHVVVTMFPFRHLVSSYVMISNVSVALISTQMKILTFWKPWRKYLYIRYIPLNHLHRVLVVFVIQCNHKILAILQGVPKKYLSGVFFQQIHLIF